MPGAKKKKSNLCNGRRSRFFTHTHNTAQHNTAQHNTTQHNTTTLSSTHTHNSKTMKLVIMVAGHATRLEKELKSSGAKEFSHLLNVPKALLPGPNGNTLLDNWWEAVSFSHAAFTGTILVTNADKYKHYERWASGKGLLRQSIVNDGTTDSTGELGAVYDLDLALRRANV